MFNALRLPRWIDHPATRHVLGRLEEGRWSRSRGLRPAFTVACVVTLGLVAARMVLPTWGRVSLPPAALVYGSLVGLLLLCHVLGVWMGLVGMRDLARDARFRHLRLAGSDAAEFLDATTVGLAARALVLPVVLFQGAVVLVALERDPSLEEVFGVFFVLFAVAMFLVAAGPVLDHGLSFGIAEALRRRPAAATFAVGLGHFLVALVVLVIGLGVFGLIHLVAQTDAWRRDAAKRFEAFLEEEATG